jgi:hypothetical protein
MDALRVACRLGRSVALCLAVLGFGAVRLAAEDDHAAAPPDQQRLTRAVELSSELVGGLLTAVPDATDWPARVLVLSPEQLDRLAQLSLAQADDRAKLLRELNRTYAGRVRDVLTEPQRQAFDAVLEVLDKLSAEASAARKEFLEAVAEGRPDWRLASLLSRTPIAVADPTEYLGLSEDKRRELERLRDETAAALHDALQQRMDREGWADPEAWRQRRQEFRQAQQKAQADYEARRNALLSPQEREELARIEAAVAGYQDRLRAARREATAKLIELLQGPEVR